MCHGIRHPLILASVHVGAQELGKALVDAAFFGFFVVGSCGFCRSSRGIDLRNLQLEVLAKLNKYWTVEVFMFLVAAMHNPYRLR